MSKFSKRSFTNEEKGALLVSIGSLMIEQDISAGESEYNQELLEDHTTRIQELLPDASAERVLEIVSYLETYEFIGSHT